MEKIHKPRKRRINEIELEQRQLAEEEYNNEVSEQRYKQLMHLLNKSKFYSSYLRGKIESKKEQGTKKKNKRPPVNDENVPPTKKKKRKEEAVKEHDLQEYASTEVSSKI